ncbi:MAG: hypothetical protein KH326_09135, partial [Ruminococcus callidus]|uniref:hypothetical protein n=2 Tax=Ruminococcus callidus TaxID=40519 RepID=UPI0023F0DB18
LDVFTSIFVKYDGKFASRWRAKSPDALCAVLPYKKAVTCKESCDSFFAYELTLAVSLDSMAKKNADCDSDGEVGSNDAVSGTSD